LDFCDGGAAPWRDKAAASCHQTRQTCARYWTIGPGTGARVASTRPVAPCPPFPRGCLVFDRASLFCLVLHREAIRRAELPRSRQRARIGQPTCGPSMLRFRQGLWYQVLQSGASRSHTCGEINEMIVDRVVSRQRGPLMRLIDCKICPPLWNLKTRSPGRASPRGWPWRAAITIGGRKTARGSFFLVSGKNRRKRPRAAHHQRQGSTPRLAAFQYSKAGVSIPRQSRGLNLGRSPLGFSSAANSQSSCPASANNACASSGHSQPVVLLPAEPFGNGAKSQQFRLL
jgi:hypothetical protein